MSSDRQHLRAVTDRLGPQRPAVVGIAGAVSVGKTTIANALAEEFAASGERVEVVTTDAFLFPNEVLAARDLQMRKGFPESYVTDAMVMLVTRAKAAQAVTIPVYSHMTYDVIPNETQTIEPADVLIIEGVVALQSPVREHLDLSVYIDAAEEMVREWFIERFLRLTDEGRLDPGSFYHWLATLGPDDVLAIGRTAWDSINAVNLHEHIAPSMKGADVTIVKGASHAIVDVVIA